MEPNATRRRATGLPPPPLDTGGVASTANAATGTSPPTVVLTGVSAKLDSFLNAAAEEAVRGDYPHPEPVIHVPEMKVPPRAPVIRPPQRERSAGETQISAQIQKLGQGMPGYGGADRATVVKLTCAAIAQQIVAVTDEKAKEELRLEMAGSLLQLVNADPKRTSLVRSLFQLHLPTLCALAPPELKGEIARRIEQLPNIQIDSLETYAASLKREFSSIMDAIAHFDDPADKVMTMGKLVNMLIQVFREKQNPEDYDQCVYLLDVVTDIINGGNGGVGGLRNAVRNLPAPGVLARQQEELLDHMKPEQVNLHMKGRPPQPQPQAVESEHVYSSEQIAALKDIGLIK